MSMEFNIEIADICAAVSVSDKDFARQLVEERYEEFLSDKPPSLRLDIDVSPVETPSLMELSQRPFDEYVKADHMYFRGFKGDIEAFVDFPKSYIKGTTIKMCYRFDALLRLVYSLWLVRSGGIMLHAAGVKDHDRVYVFCGVSGSGKTTIARLSGQRSVLSDELIAVRPVNGSYAVWGTPFLGEFAGGGLNIQSNLKHIFFLKKNSRNFLTAPEKIERLKSLFECVLFFGENSELLDTVFHTCLEIVEKVPFYELHFLPDEHFWNTIKVMEG